MHDSNMPGVRDRHGCSTCAEPGAVAVNPTDKLVDDFAEALKAKLHAAEAKYGWNDGWMKADWEAKCQAHLVEHVAKGDPRDVAAYCAFMWYHGWKTTDAGAVAVKQPAQSFETWFDGDFARLSGKNDGLDEIRDSMEDIRERNVVAYMKIAYEAAALSVNPEPAKCAHGEMGPHEVFYNGVSAGWHCHGPALGDEKGETP